MSDLNPVAVGFCIFAGSLGYALGEGHGAAIGVAIVSGLMTLRSLFV